MPDTNISNAEQTNTSQTNFRQTSSNQQTQTSEILTMSKSMTLCLELDWDEYNLQLQGLSKGYQLSACLKLLGEADRLLNQQGDLLDSSVSERMLLAGYADSSTQKDYPFDIQNLGGVAGFASFKKLIKSDPVGLNKLMKIIPKTGIVDGWHYLQFIDTYQQWFIDNGHKQAYLFPATRLLTMKRPDQFIPLNTETNSIVCETFAIKVLKKQDFKRYWDEVITRIHKTQWYKIFQPMDAAQLPFHRVRVALLERMAMVPINLINNLEVNETTNRDTNESNPSIDTIEATSELLNEKLKTDSNNQNQHKNNKKTNPFIRDEIAKKPKVEVKQPKKMTIGKLQTAKGNQNAATKLMSQYYFANRKEFEKIDIKKHRETIIEQLIAGESVEEIFASFL